jgi:hypothetical protein
VSVPAPGSWQKSVLLKWINTLIIQ